VPYTIPNATEAAFSPQAMLNRVDMEILALGIARSGISTGCDVTTTGAANGSVAVASGVAVVAGVYANVVAGNVSITSNASGNPRRDLVTIDNTGAKSTVVGTPGAVPLLPSIPSNRTVLADVYVPNGHTGSSTIAADQITDKRIQVGTSDFQAHNVLEYGAIGDANHNTGGGADDTAAIQAAFTAAQAVNGFGVVVFPAGRTYRITDTIETAVDVNLAPAWVWGVGSMARDRVAKWPNITWDGAAGGVMFNTEQGGNNISAGLYRNIRLIGRDIANTGIRYGPTESLNVAKLDSGSGLDEVHLGAFAGNAISVEGLGSTNFWIRGGRWDKIQGYALYMRVGSTSFVTIRDVTWDATVTTVFDYADGFAHFDGANNDAYEGTANTHYVLAHFDSVHFESGGLKDTVPTASETAGRRGIIKCSIDTAEVVCQHHMTFTNCQVLGWNSSDDSHCLIQMSGGTTNAERKARLNFNGRNVHGFNGDGSAATGHVIPFGNMGLTNPDPGDTYQELTHRFSGGGVTASRYPRVWNNTA
jgi:hypothetical protein